VAYTLQGDWGSSNTLSLSYDGLRRDSSGKYRRYIRNQEIDRAADKVQPRSNLFRILGLSQLEGEG
jgi:hypothetical protein